MNAMKRPSTIFLLLVVGLLLFSNWRTRSQLDAEREMRLNAIAAATDSFFSCQPSVYLRGTNPVDAIASMRYRDAQNGRGCVFLSDGRYGNLWWSIITEDKHKAHLEWNFQELGKYKW